MAFSGPLPGSLGLESGRNYMIGCPDKTTDLAVSRLFKLDGARTAQFRVEIQRLQYRGIQRAASIFRSQNQPPDLLFSCEAVEGWLSFLPGEIKEQS